MLAGESTEALALLEKAVALDESMRLAKVGIAASLRRSGKFDDALDLLDQLVEDNPNDGLAYAHRGLVRFFRGREASAERREVDFEAAVADYGRAIDLRPEDSRSYGNRGFMYVLAGQEEAARRDLERAAELTESAVTRAHDLENLGILFLNQGRWRVALAHAIMVDDVVSTDWNSLFMGIAADKIGDDGLARQALERWRTGDPAGRQSSSLLIYLDASLHKYVTGE